jgi:hypothetical protein
VRFNRAAVACQILATARRIAVPDTSVVCAAISGAPRPFESVQVPEIGEDLGHRLES